MSLKIGERTARKLQQMLDQQQVGGPPPADAGYREPSVGFVLVRNVGDEAIPAYSCVQPMETATRSGRIVVDVEAWDGISPGPFLFTWHGEIAIDSQGVAQTGSVVRVRYAEGFTPDPGTSAGPTTDMEIGEGAGAGYTLGPYDEANRLALIVPNGAQAGARFIKAPSGGIPARVGTLLGYATCDVYSTGTTGYTISDTGANIEVVNWSKSAACVNGDRFGVAAYWSGRWWIVSEDCGDTSAGTGSAAMLRTGGTTDEDNNTGLTQTYDSAAAFKVSLATLGPDTDGLTASAGTIPEV